MVISLYTLEANCILGVIHVCLFVLKKKMRNSHANIILSCEQRYQTMFQGAVDTDVSNQGTLKAHFVSVHPAFVNKDVMK